MRSAVGRPTFLTALSSLMVLIATTVYLAAQDKLPPGKAKGAAPNAGVTEKDPVKAFAVLMSKREELVKRLQQLEKSFQEADDAGKKKIQADFQKIIADFREGTLPNLVKLAVPLYLKDAKNEDAEEIVLGHLQEMFTENKYNDVIALTDQLIAAGRKVPAILNFSGVSHFAVQDFAKAQTILTEAKELNDSEKPEDPKEAGEQSIFDRLGSRYLDNCPKYIALWKKEQEIRAKEAKAPAAEKLPHVLFKTNKGDIELELFENQAPNSVANFVNLVENHKYDGTVFHRVEPNFMAQGGDPNTLDNNPGNDGRGGPGYQIACECDRKDARMHFQGSLSMAHAGKDTGGSQFFLTHLPTDHLNGKHTVFGRIVKGLEIALDLRPGDKIVTATVLNKRNHKYVPEKIK